MSIFKPTPAAVSSSLRRLAPHEAKSFLRRAKFCGDSVILSHQPFELNAKYLEKIGLVPTYATSFAALEIALTPSFTAGEYTAALAFIRSPEDALVAAYYLDETLGFWYYLPDYLMSSSSQASPIERLGKGYRLESLRLPTVLQITLNQLATQPPLELTPSSALFSFAGTAQRYRSHADFLQALRSGALTDHPYYANVQAKPLLCLNASSTIADTPPTALALTGPTAPDFSTLQPVAYQISTIFCPEIYVDLCDSQDGNYQYNFCRDSANHAWLGAVEAQSSITPLALPSQWIALGAFGTPLYLDALHADSYGDLTDRRHGHYLNMWPKYLSQAPFLQDYLHAIQESALKS